MRRLLTSTVCIPALLAFGDFGASGCRESSPPATTAEAGEAPSPPVDAASAADRPDVNAPAATTVDTVVTSPDTTVASATAPAEDAASTSAMASDAAATSAMASDAASAPDTVGPAAVLPLTERDESDRCTALLASIVPDLEESLGSKLTEKDKRCSILKKLDDPPAIAFVIDELPSVEGPWSPSRLAVRSGNRWYAIHLATRGTRILKLEAGPWERALRLEVAVDEWEIGSAVGKRRLLFVCQLPAEPGAAPRCAQHSFTYKYKPLADEAPPEDWIADVHVTPAGLRFEPIKGKFPADMEKPPVGDMTLDAFLAKGAALEPE